MIIVTRGLPTIIVIKFHKTTKAETWPISDLSGDHRAAYNDSTGHGSPFFRAWEIQSLTLIIQMEDPRGGWFIGEGY